eukprot:2575503-Karenia_brevis.AAC.1
MSGRLRRLPHSKVNTGIACHRIQGCGYDLVSQRAIRQAMRQGTGKLIPSTHELTFHTGNGIAKSSK